MYASRGAGYGQDEGPGGSENHAMEVQHLEPVSQKPRAILDYCLSDSAEIFHLVDTEAVEKLSKPILKTSLLVASKLIR